MEVVHIGDVQLAQGHVNIQGTHLASFPGSPLHMLANKCEGGKDGRVVYTIRWLTVEATLLSASHGYIQK